MTDLPELLAATAAVIAVLLYGSATTALRRRGDHWPVPRQACFVLGGTSLVVAALVPLPVGEFSGHMVRHLIVGMSAPLLLVLGRPVTLALRTLPSAPRRELVYLLHSRLAGWLVFPPLAAVLDVGGLWVLYRTSLFAATEHHAWLHAATHLHVLAAGLLFIASICQLDPLRRRRSLPFRAAVLVAAGAAHGILAKSLYIAAPPLIQLPVADTELGAELMYYGGDVVQMALAAVIALQWYAGTGRELARRRRRADLVSVGRVAETAGREPTGGRPRA